MKSLSEYILEAQNYDDPPKVAIVSYNNKNAKQTYYGRSGNEISDTIINNSEDIINVFKPLKWAGEKCFEQWAKCIDPDHIGDYDFYDNVDRADIEGFDGNWSMRTLKESKWTLIPYWYQNEKNLCILGLDVKNHRSFMLEVQDNDIVNIEKVKKIFGFEDKKFLLAIRENFTGWNHVFRPNLEEIYSAICFAMKSNLK